MTVMPESPPILLADGVHKRYGGVHALRGAHLHVRPGEVHVLVGENGSGKSTLLKILSGQVQPRQRRDHARRQADARSATPTEALRQGIATVTQETTLAPDLSIAENVFLGHRMVAPPRLHRLAATRAGARARRSPASASTSTRRCRCAGCGPTSSRWSRSPARSRSTRAC